MADVLDKLIELSCYQGWWEQTDGQTQVMTTNLKPKRQRVKNVYIKLWLNYLQKLPESSSQWQLTSTQPKYFISESNFWLRFQAIPPVHYPENAPTPQTWPISQSQNAAKMRKIDSDHNLKVIRIHQHAEFQAIPPMHSLKNDWKPQFWVITLRFLARVTLKFVRWHWKLGSHKR